MPEGRLRVHPTVYEYNRERANATTVLSWGLEPYRETRAAIHHVQQADMALYEAEFGARAPAGAPACDAPMRRAPVLATGCARELARGWNVPAKGVLNIARALSLTPAARVRARTT